MWAVRVGEVEIVYQVESSKDLPPKMTETRAREPLLSLYRGPVRNPVHICVSSSSSLAIMK